MTAWWAGAMVGIAAGAIGGFLAGLLELILRRRANQIRRRKGEPVARNEVVEFYWAPGAAAGGLIGALAIEARGWAGAALPAFGFPIVVWLCGKLWGLVRDLVGGGRRDALSPGDIPGPDADWPSISAFALSFDGYECMGSFEACGELANDAMVAYAERGELPETLMELRTCLFFEQRRMQHMGPPPDSQSMAYIRALVEAIRDKVPAAEQPGQ